MPSESTSGYKKQEDYPPSKEGERSKRPVPTPRKQKIAGRFDMKYSQLLFWHPSFLIVF